MKLFRAPDLDGLLVGEDPAGSLVQWPAEPRGWAKRTPYLGSKRALEEADRELARGTGWPGSPRGPAPRAGETAKNFTIRATDAERSAWKRAAGDRDTAAWARDELNAAAARPRAKR